ncbi:MAG: hypothetical protein AAGG75_08335 [Bacteroidota bacterium]
MENTERPLDEQLEQLLRSKRFADLNTQEKSQVLDQLSQEEYERYHHILQGSRTLFAQHPAPPPMGPRLKNALSQNRLQCDQNSYLRQPIAAWKAALTVAATALLFLFIGHSQGKKMVGEPVYVYKIDTIYQEMPSFTSNKKKEDGTVIATRKTSLQASESYADSSSIPATFPSGRSRSLTTDRELMTFMTDVY